MLCMITAMILECKKMTIRKFGQEHGGLPLLHCLLITNAHAVCAHTTVTACLPLVGPVPVNEIDHGKQQPNEDLLF